MPRISVVSPCYNASAFIAQTIESVRNQTFTDWEHVIVDDGSTDDSAAIVEACQANEPRVRLVRQANRGRTSACNAGVRHTSPDSTYLLFLDADDYLEPDMFEVLSRYLDAHGAVGAVHCEHTLIDAHGRALDKAQYDYLGPRYAPAWYGARALGADDVRTPFAAIFVLTAFICTMTLIRRSVYDATPGWDEQFGLMYDDIDLFLQIAVRSEVHFCPRALARYRRHAAQDTATTAADTELRLRDKLYQKWTEAPGLTDAMRQVVVDANRFRQGALALRLGLQETMSFLRRGEIQRGLRTGVATVRRYGGYQLHRWRG